MSEYETEAKAMFQSFVSTCSEDEPWEHLDFSHQMEWVRLAIPVVLNRRLVESNGELTTAVNRIAAVMETNKELTAAVKDVAHMIGL